MTEVLLRRERESSIVKLLHGNMMDFRVHSAAKLEMCVSKLVQMFDNILVHPDENKYRKVCRRGSAAISAQAKFTSLRR